MSHIEYDPLREYDRAVVAKMGGVLDTPVGGKPQYQVQVAGISKPVPLNVGLPEDWYKEFTVAGVNIKRGEILPAPSRRLPNFRGQELSINPDTPNTWNIQNVPAQPVNIMYEVELTASSSAHINLLVIWLLRVFPSSHFGTFLEVDGSQVNYEGTGMNDKTSYRSKDGRQFVYGFDYTVEGWLIPDLSCEKAPQILSMDVALETHRTRGDLHKTPPVEESEADEVVHAVYP